MAWNGPLAVIERIVMLTQTSHITASFLQTDLIIDELLIHQSDCSSSIEKLGIRMVNELDAILPVLTSLAFFFMQDQCHLELEFFSFFTFGFQKNYLQLPGLCLQIINYVMNVYKIGIYFFVLYFLFNTEYGSQYFP